MKKLAALAALMLSCSAMSAFAQDVCPKRGGTLTMTYADDPVALSTMATTSVVVSILDGKVYESLITGDGPEMKPAPQLATSWTESPDGKTYTFQLRHGVKWQDGVPFTSADVKFSIEKAIRPYHSRGDVFFAQLASIDTPDDYTVVFHLKQAVPYFLEAFTSGSAPILPKHILEKVDTSSRAAVVNSSLTAAPIGTGPFRFKAWVKGSYVELERNPDYWGGPSCLDAIVMRSIPDGTARAVALQNGEIDVAPMNSISETDIERISKMPQFVVTDKGTEGLGGIVWLELNLRQRELADVRVRQALSMALDRQAIVNVIFDGRGVAARGPLVSTNPFYDKSLPPLEYSLAKANAMLDAAGYKRGPDGTRFAIKQLILPTSEDFTRLSEYVRQQFKRIGVTVTTQSMDYGTWLKTVYSDYNFGITSTSTDNRNDPTMGTESRLTTGGIKKGATFQNASGYSNPKMDALFAEGAVENDPVKRKAIFDQMQVLAQADMPDLFLVEIARVSVWNKRVHGILTNGLSYYGGWDHVWKE